MVITLKIRDEFGKLRNGGVGLKYGFLYYNARGTLRINLYTWWTVCKEYVWFMMKNLALFNYLSWFIYILIDDDRSNWLRSNKIDLLLTVGLTRRL